MRFFVTYCTTDQELASNPFWHACLLLSYWPEQDKKIEVMNAWGFYGSRSTTQNFLLRKIKTNLGIDIDIQGNHGRLIREEIRFLDLGYGLRGMTFDISFEQFIALKYICNTTLIQQQQAIAEAESALSEEKAKPSSYDIFQYELKMAAQENREPRLKPFDFHLKPAFSFIPLSFEDSHTCKTTALGMLRKIGINEEWLNYISSHNTSTTFPRWGGELYPIALHSRGSAHPYHSNRTGKISFIKDWSEKGTRLYWTVVPQMLVTSSKNLHDAFSLPEAYCDEIMLYVRQLQQIETVFNNQNKPEAYDDIIQYTRGLYEFFSIPANFSQESKLTEHVMKIKEFLNSLYFCICDKWDDEEEKVLRQALSLPNDLQQQICELMGRSYSPLVENYY